MAKPEETGVLSARVPLEFFARVEEFVTERDPAKGGRTRLMVAALESYMKPLAKAERIPTSKKSRPMAPLSQHTKARINVYHAVERLGESTTSDISWALNYRWCLNQTPNNVAKRVQELAAENYIEPTGEYRKSRDSGRMLTIWRRTAKQYTGV
jgi:hypothetical protein